MTELWLGGGWAADGPAPPAIVPGPVDDPGTGCPDGATSFQGASKGCVRRCRPAKAGVPSPAGQPPADRPRCLNEPAAVTGPGAG